MQAIREARETGGKTKETSFRTFGLNEKLFTPKYEQTRNEKTFKNVLKAMEEDIQEKEQQRLVFQRQQSIRRTISNLSLELKLSLSNRLKQYEADEKASLQQSQSAVPLQGSLKSSMKKSFIQPTQMSPQKLQKALVETVLKPYGLHLFMNNTAGGGRYKNRNSLTVAPTPQNETTTTELA